MRKFLNLFSVNDPGWGNSHNTSGSKDAKGGQEGDQTPKTDPGNGNQPVETQPNSPTATPPVKPPAAKPDGPPDLDELAVVAAPPILISQTHSVLRQP